MNGEEFGGSIVSVIMSEHILTAGGKKFILEFRIILRVHCVLLNSQCHLPAMQKVRL